MRRLLGALLVAGGALVLPACGPAAVDIGYGPDYYGYAPDYYYGGGYGFYGAPYYNRPGITIGRGYYGHGYGRGYGRGYYGYGHHGRVAPPAARVAPPAARSYGHAPAPHYAGPPPGGHHR